MKNIYKWFFFFLLVNVCFAQSGAVKSYYPDKTLKSELTYVNDILDGPAVWYHPNGKVMLEKYYSKGILSGWIREYYDNGKLKEESFIKNGIKDGDDKLYYADGNLKQIISYADGRQINKQVFESVESTQQTEQIVSVPAQNTSKEEVTKDIYVQATVVGGITSVQEKIIYPEDAIKFGLEGTVSLKVTVDQSGNPVKTEIIKGIGLGCNEAALNAVKQARFIPATKNGSPADSEILLDLTFKLPAKKEEVTRTTNVEQTEIPKEIRKYEDHLSIMCEADRCPRLEDDMNTIYSRIQIPNVAKALKLRGMILIEGIVDKEGKLKQTKIIEGMGYGVDQSVEAALINSKFIPAIKKGETVETKALINFPFSFDK